jgi:hypothetical protein
MVALRVTYNQALYEDDTLGGGNLSSRVLLMKNNSGGVGKGYEDTVGATAIRASGGPIWKEEVRRVLMTRSDHAVRCVTDLIDHMILETQKLYKGTGMEDRCMLFHDALAQ